MFIETDSGWKMNNKGFSLIELIVSIGIMSLVMIIATTMMTSASNYFELQNARVEIQNESQLVVNHLSEVIMEATGMQFTYDEATGTGTYILFSDGSKGNQRVLFYDNDKHSLYIVSYENDTNKVADIPTDGSWIADAYLISDEITSFHMDYDWGYSTSPEDINPATEPSTEAGTDPADAPKKVVRNPLKVRITFTIAHNKASGDFEITADCRNALEKITINGVEYTALSR